MAGVSVKKTDLPDYYNELGVVIEEDPFDKYCISCAVDDQQNDMQGNPYTTVKDEDTLERALLAAQKKPVEVKHSGDKVSSCNDISREAALRSIIKDIAGQLSKTSTAKTGLFNAAPEAESVCRHLSDQ